MALTTEQLLASRFKIIAGYPDMRVKVGNILGQIGQTDDYSENPDDEYAGYGPTIRNPEAFPAVFKRLEWWEDREQDELPLFVRVQPGKSFFLGGVRLSEGRVMTFASIKKPSYYHYVTPATPEEYAAFEAANE